MRTITLEEHFLTTSFVDALAAAGTPIPPNLARLNPQLLDLGAGRIAAMDAAGIDLQVLSMVSALGLDGLNEATATPLAADVNDELADAISKHPARLAGFATLCLKNPVQAAREFERTVTKLGFKGALVDGTIDGLFLDDPRFIPLFETAVALDVPVYLHPAPPPEPVMKAYFQGLPGENGELLGQMLAIAGWGWHSETALHTLRLIVAGVFDRFPTLQLVIGHMGEMLPMALARSSAVLTPAAKIARPVADYFQTNIHITTSGYFTQPPLKLALEVIGIDRLMFSVDYPFSPNTKGRDFLADAAQHLSPDEMAQLSYQNAERLLKL